VTACVHHQLGRCAAGVDVEALRDEHLRLPCVEVRGVRGSVGCDELELPAATAPMSPGPMASLLADLEAGRCATCKGVIEAEKVDEGDGLVIALPCRHRLRSPAPTSRPPGPARQRLQSGAAARDQWERDQGDEEVR
jgi:hypothetical protein